MAREKVDRGDGRRDAERRGHAGDGEALLTLHSAFARHVAVLVIAVAILFFLRSILDVVLLFFAGILLALFLRALTDIVQERTSLSENWSFGLVTVALLVLIVAIVTTVVPNLADQVDRLITDLPRAINQLESYVARYRWGEWLLGQTGDVQQLVPARTTLLTRVTGVLSDSLSVLANTALVIGIGFYVALHPEEYRDGLIRLFPLDKRERAAEVLSALGSTLRRWLVGRGVAILVDGTLTAIGLWLLGMPLILTLTLIEAVLVVVPFFGPLLAAIPAVLLALLISPTMALYIAALYLIIEMLESYVVTPLVQKEAVWLPPALTIGSVVVLGVLFGPLGVFLATPVTATVIVLVKLLYIEDILGEPVKLPGDEDENNHRQTGLRGEVAR